MRVVGNFDVVTIAVFKKYTTANKSKCPSLYIKVSVLLSRELLYIRTDIPLFP